MKLGNIKLKLIRKILESKYNSGNLDYVIKKITNHNINKKMVYIWYCPRSCNAIVTKTSEPFLKSGTKHRCKRCKELYTAEYLISKNKRNIKKYLSSIDKETKV